MILARRLLKVSERKHDVLEVERHESRYTDCRELNRI